MIQIIQKYKEGGREVKGKVNTKYGDTLIQDDYITD